MQVRHLPREVSRGARTAAELDRRSEALEAAINKRVELVRRWRRAMALGLSSREAASAVGVSRATLYRWRRMPEPRSKRPRRVRSRQWTGAQIRAVEAFRRQYPAWGRRRIGHLLRHPVRRDSRAMDISDATVGRILAFLVATGRARPVLCFTAASRQLRRRQARRVRRLGGALRADEPGGAVQIDTLSIWFPSNHTVKQFTAVDRVSRWATAMAASRATAASAKRFLDRLIEQAPFPIKAIQVDGGSEFMADFEQACADRSIELCVLPPRSPKLNGRVERLQATYRHEFYASYSLPHRIESLNRCLDDFNHHYNHQRPHQALDGRTPWHYLHNCAA